MATIAMERGLTPRRRKRRATIKKERRKRKRQSLAKIRDSELQNDREQQESEDGDEEKRVEDERQKLHLEWLERERVAQEEFKLKREKEEAARRKKEEEEKRIKEEWEARERKEQEEREKKQQEKKEREEAVQKMLDQAESQMENGSPWKNPEAPMDYGTEKDRANCPFFLKTGACRFGDRCSRKHVRPACSSTLMIRAMFVTFGMEQSRRDDYDTDASLEYSEEELRQQFLEFYEDVLPEFKSTGKVMQFKVSCNFEPHLRGNVYVQYETEEQCKGAFMMFNGRWYAGKQLQCEFCPVTRWKTAICGLFDRHKCPKGKHCNFLHVYRNPGNEFWEADHDLHHEGDFTGRYSGRYTDNKDRCYGQHSYSPGRSRHGRGDRRRHSGEWSSHSRVKRSRSREGRGNSRVKRSRSREGRGNSRVKRSRSREERGNSRVKRSRSREERGNSRVRRSRSREGWGHSRVRRSRSREGWGHSRVRRSGSCEGQGHSQERKSSSYINEKRKSRERNGEQLERKNGSPVDLKERGSPAPDSSKRYRKCSNKDSSRKQHSSDEPGRFSDGSPVYRRHKDSKKSKKKKNKKKKDKRRKMEAETSISDNESGNQTPSMSEQQRVGLGGTEKTEGKEGIVPTVSSCLCPPQEPDSQPSVPEQKAEETLS